MRGRSRAYRNRGLPCSLTLLRFTAELWSDGAAGALRAFGGHRPRSSVHRKGGLNVPQVSGVRAGLDCEVDEARCHLQQGGAQIPLAGGLRCAEELVRLLDIYGDRIGFHARRVITPALNKRLTWLTKTASGWRAGRRTAIIAPCSG